MIARRLCALRRLARLGLLALLGGALPAYAAPYVPAADEVLERGATGSDPGDAELRRLNAALAAGRANRVLAVQVARLDISRGQASTDTRYFGRAEAALAPWIGAAAPPPDVQLLRGMLRQTNHDFDPALADLGAVLDAEPRNGQARLTRAVVRLVRADYDGAEEDCAQLVGVAPAGTMDSCVAAVAGMTGHGRPALVMLGVVATEPDVPPPVRVWALTLRGEIAARTGDPASAFGAFEQARALAPDDAYLLAAYADALLDAGRPADVLPLLADRTRADVLLLRLLEAEQRLGTPDPELVGQLADRFETSRRRGETIHQREEARFALHVGGRPDEALRLARANWQVQHEPADARILVEAAIAARSPADAAPVLAWRRDSGIEDAVLDRLASGLGTAAR